MLTVNISPTAQESGNSVPDAVFLQPLLSYSDHDSLCICRAMGDCTHHWD